MAEWNNISNGIPHSKESVEAQKPCLKHAAENLSEISKYDASSETALCSGCSKTMLSYIVLIQDMLGSLARKLSKNEDTSCCEQCLQQESRNTENCPLVVNVSNNHLINENLENSNKIANDEREPLSAVPSVSEPKDKIQTNDANPIVTTSGEVKSEPKKPRKVSSRRNSRRISREMKANGNNNCSENSVNRNGWQTDFLYNVSSSVEPKYIPYKALENENLSSSSLDSSPITPTSPTLFFNHLAAPPMAVSENAPESTNFKKPNINISSRDYYSAAENNSNYHKPDADDFVKLDYSSTGSTLNHAEVHESAKSDYSGNSSPFEADVDDSLKSDYSGTESSERETENISMKLIENEKTSHQDVENWRTLRDSFNGPVIGKDRRKCSEAFVTICRNNAEALGCLVLGSSLLLSRTSKKLCVLVFDDVDPAFKEPLSSIFHVLQHVRHLKTVDERNIEYLKQRNLEKLNIWNFVQFSKCVFLNPDCLILRNCDELFHHEELSAVPDIGWPDCFNAGVFVFAPSVQTLSKLVELSQKQGQNNEGDQMLLNAYFDSWSTDIGKKLSFIYNLMRNASYTYGPAFQRFGQNIKIVQFLGGSKPWEVKFSTQTGHLDGDADIHPKHVRFFSEWINTFKIAVMKLFPQDVYSYAFNQMSISAEEIGFALCFPALCKGFGENSVKPFHILPNRRSVPPFYLAAPSLRKTAENNTSASSSGQLSDAYSTEEATQKPATIEQDGKRDGTQNGKTEKEVIFSEICLPGATVGDYHGMKAWEQGNYEGCDSSENIINRLSFLIRQSV